MSLGNESTPMTMPVAPIGAGGGYGFGGFGGFGGDGLIALIMMFLFPMIYGGMGWGGMGWGGMGMMGGMGMWPWLFGGFGGNGCNGNAATQADVQRAVDQQTLISKIDQQTYGISSAAYDLNNTMQNGFSSAELSRCNQQAALMQMLYQMSSNQQDCCCQTLRAIEGVNYNLAAQSCDTRNTIQNATRDIIDNDNRNHQALMDKLCQMEYNGLNDKYQAALSENQALRFAASQDRQNALFTATAANNVAQVQAMFNRQFPQAQPAYVVPNPNCCYGNPQVTFGGSC